MKILNVCNLNNICSKNFIETTFLDMKFFSCCLTEFYTMLIHSNFSCQIENFVCRQIYVFFKKIWFNVFLNIFYHCDISFLFVDIFYHSIKRKSFISKKFFIKFDFLNITSDTTVLNSLQYLIFKLYSKNLDIY